MSQVQTLVPVSARLAKSGAAKAVLVELPRSATVADLIAKLTCGQNATLLIDDCTPASTTTLGDLHDRCSADDGFLHITVVAEKAMGNPVYAGCFNCAFGP